jgi:hypothetical protein
MARVWVIAITFIIVTMVGCVPPPQAERVAGPTPASTHTPTATLTAVPTVTPFPTATPTHTPTPTPTPPPYTLESVPVQRDLGVIEAHFVTHQPVVESVHPDDLTLPHENLIPHIGRFLQPRYYTLIHLGTDYRNPTNDMMAPPHPDAVLVGTLYTLRRTYTSVAIDMSGESQMYLIELDPGGQYLFCFAHFSAGSNEKARQQALDNDGRVAEMGKITLFTPTTLSDFHIAVIDVDSLYRFTETDNLPEALRLLIGNTLPITNQQYASIFVRPEAVWPALDTRLKEYDGVVPQDP